MTKISVYLKMLLPVFTDSAVFHISENGHVAVRAVLLRRRRAEQGDAGAGQLRRQEGPRALHPAGQPAARLPGQGGSPLRRLEGPRGYPLRRLEGPRGCALGRVEGPREAYPVRRPPERPLRQDG